MIKEEIVFNDEVATLFISATMAGCLSGAPGHSEWTKSLLGENEPVGEGESRGRKKKKEVVGR